LKYYYRLFLLCTLVFTLAIGSGLYLYIHKAEAETLDFDTTETIMPNIVIPDIVPDAPKSPLDQAIESSKRVNILLIGTDGGRADTIMLLSFDPAGKYLDLISVPRDTYNEVPGYDRLDQKKINAVIGLNNNNGGPEGLTVQVSKLLQVPIPYYVRVDYNAVMDVVDTLGGVKVTVPFDMDYDDEMAKPPLHIHLTKGPQVLDGNQAMQYIRWRKNNGSEGLGDLNRISRQQSFMKSAIKKSLSFKLPSVVKTAMQYVDTNMPLDQALYYASEAVGMNTEDIISGQIPGEVKTKKLSYYFHDPVLTEILMLSTYTRSHVEASIE
jgi:LCP family protein required for cell wall assembly